jgi:predicted CXXCH cytochrome family protein
VYGTEHEVLIADLKPGKTYRFAAASRDLFGNRLVSPPQTFSTRVPFSAPAPAPVPEKVRVAARYFRTADQLLLRFSANQPVGIRLQAFGNPAAAGADGGRKAAVLPEGHPALAAPRFLNLDVCVSCHPGSRGSKSHPVDIFPKKGMHIDANIYRLLENGRISCMSCHVPHAADSEYRLVRAGKKALCLGCHGNR